jgi:plastocyanin
MRPSHCFTLAVCFTAGFAALAVGRGAAPPAAPDPSKTSTRPADANAAAIRGTITAESEVPLDEMVLYLESPDADRAMPPPGEAVDVSQKGARFEPKLVVVTVGQTVNFLNNEEREIEHNVFSISKAKKFDLGLYGPNQSKSVTFDKPGPVLLRCTIHRYMDGVVFVSPTPYRSLVSKDGRYEIADVPPGKWTLKTWQGRRRFAEQTVPVTVESGKPVTVDMELKKRK